MASIPLTVVVPLYNKRETVQRCIESILKQTFSGFELIVVDDGSTDGSPDIVRQFDDPRLTLIHQSNAGVSVARNRGIELARGELVAFLDADDYWEPRFLEAIVELRRLYPQAGLLASGVGRCWLDGRPDELLSARPNAASPTTALLSYFEGGREGSFVTSSNVCIPRSILQEVGGFQPGLAMGEDRDTWIRIALRYPAACDTRILAHYFTPRRPSQPSLANEDHQSVAFVVNLIDRMFAGEVPPSVLPAVESFVDSMHRRHCASLAWYADSLQLRAFLVNTRCHTPGGRLYFRLARLCLALFPLTLVRALIIKPRLFWLKLRTSLPGPAGRLFSFLRRTEEPCRHLDGSPGSR